MDAGLLVGRLGTTSFKKAFTGCESRVGAPEKGLPEVSSAHALQLALACAQNRPLTLVFGSSPPLWAEALPAGTRICSLWQIDSFPAGSLKNARLLVSVGLQELTPVFFKALQRKGAAAFFLLRPTRIIEVKLWESPGWLDPLRRRLCAALANMLTQRVVLKKSAQDTKAGHAYRAEVETENADCLVFENGKPLLWPGVAFSEIVEKGAGRHACHDASVYFSSSDNSDPVSSGRIYRFVLQKGWRWRVLRWVFGMEDGQPFLTPENLREMGASRAKTRLRLRLHAGTKVLAKIRYPFADRKPRGGKVVLFTSHLKTGGAERQLCNLARHLRRTGLEPSVLTLEREDGASSYHSLLAGIQRASCEVPSRAFAWNSFFELSAEKKEVLLALPRNLQWRVWNAYTYLAGSKPDVLHCFLNRPNIIGAIAGWLAGVPKVVLSIRNADPNCAKDQHGWDALYKKCYALLAKDRALVLGANSQAGIRDYANWCGLPETRFVLMRNIVDTQQFCPLDQEHRCAVRRGIGVAAHSPMLVGAFRMIREKGPMRFLDVVERIVAVLPEMAVVVCGDGKLAEAFVASIKRRGLEQHVRYLGIRKDIGQIFGAGDLLLLTSDREGTPNVALEAQAMAVPVVATDVGGTSEAMRHGQTGFIHKPEELPELTSSCLRVLEDRTLREKLGREGRAFVEANFSTNRVTDHLRSVYGLA